MRCVVATRVAVAIGVGHTAGKGGGSLAIGAGCSVAPASIAARRVFSHLGPYAYRGKRRVVVGVEAILFHLLSPFFLIVLTSFAFPPEDDTCQK